MMLKMADAPLSGLKRIVMINSGQADYVEIEPSSSLHLIGDNGIGKSMILATIQFLLIDDWTQGRMKLSRGATKHKPFYFPTSKSYIIFELESLEHTRHLYVMRGLGRTNNNDIEKWAIQGCWYDQSIFVSKENNKTVILGWSEVLANLDEQSASPPTKITTRSQRVAFLRDTLGWFSKKTPYEMFSRLFIQFLKLSSIRQRELSKHIIATSLEQNMPQSIDIDEEFSTLWNSINEERIKLSLFGEKRKKIINLISTYDDLKSRKGAFSQRWIELNPMVQAWMEGRKSDLDKIVKDLSKLQSRESELKEEINVAETNHEGAIKQVLELKQKINGLEDTQSFAKSFNPNETDTNLNTIDDRLSELQALIGSTKLHDVKTLISKRDKLESSIKQRTRFLENYETTLHHAIVEAGVKKDEIEKAFKILDSGLLSQPGKINQEGTAADWIRELSSSVNQQTAIINGLELHFDNLEQTIPESKHSRKVLEVERKDFKAIIQSIKAAEDIAPITDEIVELGDQRYSLTKDLKRYEKWEEVDKETLLGLRKPYQDSIELRDGISKQKTTLSDERLGINDRRRSLTDAKDALHKRAENEDSFRGCVTILGIESYPITEVAPEHEPDDILKNITRLRNDCDQYQKDSLKFDTIFSTLKIELIHVINSENEESFIEQAKERIAGFEKATAALDEQWRQLMINLGSACDGMSKSLREVKRKVDKINAGIAKRRITNLEEIHIGFRKRDDMVESIKKISQFTEFDKYDSSIESRVEYRTLKKLFEDRPRIELIELFNLDVSVKKPGESELRRIGTIDESGSDGTITAIKCHLMMLLMSDMLGSERARVPIFLDETGTLGPGNYKQILDMAKDLGFQIMTASPQPVEEAERQHLVVGHGKSERLRIYPEHFVSAIEDTTGDVSD